MKTLMEFFRTPSAQQLAVRELEAAERQLLEAQTALDYAKRIVEYQADRVKRLTIYVSKGQA